MTDTYRVEAGDLDVMQAARLSSKLLQFITQRPPHKWDKAACPTCGTEGVR